MFYPNSHLYGEIMKENAKNAIFRTFFQIIRGVAEGRRCRAQPYLAALVPKNRLTWKISRYWALYFDILDS